MLNEEPKSFLKNDDRVTEDVIKQGKDKYIDKGASFDMYYDHIIDKESASDLLEKHFEIIEAFANKEHFFNNESNSIVENKKITELNTGGKIQNTNAKTKDNSKNNYFVTDIHGDLFSLLQVLTGNEDNTKNPAQFKKGEPCVVYRDVTKNPPVIYNNISKIEDIDLKNLVPIPNLEPNPDFQGNFIFGGDIIDRGNESESCFYTLENLMNENNLLGENKNSIVYEIGNHEELILLNKKSLSEDNGFKALNSDINGRMDYMRLAMQNMLKNNNMQLMHTENNNIYCHAVVNKDSILKALNFLRKDFFTDKLLQKHFIGHNITLDNIDQLKIKISTGELNTNDIKLLVKTLNTLTKYHFGEGIKNPEILKLFCETISIENSENKEVDFFDIGLLWDREESLKTNPENEIKGVGLFFVGHDRQNNQIIRRNGQHCFADFGTSNEYHEDNKNITAAHVLEVDQNSKVLSHFQEFDRRKFYKKYEQLENDIKMIIEEKIVQTIKNAENKTYSPSVGSENTTDLDIAEKKLEEKKFFEEAFTSHKNDLNSIINIFRNFVENNKDVIRADLKYAKEITDFAIKTFNDMNIENSHLYIFELTRNTTEPNILNAIAEHVISDIDKVAKNIENVKKIENIQLSYSNILDTIMKNPKVNNLKLNEDIVIKILKGVDNIKEFEGDFLSKNNIKTFYKNLAKHCENVYVSNVVAKMTEKDPFDPIIFQENIVELSTNSNERKQNLIRDQREVLDKLANLNQEHCLAQQDPAKTRN